MALDFKSQSNLCLRGLLQVPGDPCFHWRDHLSDLANKDGVFLEPTSMSSSPGAGGICQRRWTTNTVSNGEGRARTDTWDRTWVCVCGDRDTRQKKRDVISGHKTISDYPAELLSLRNSEKAHEMGSDTGWALKMQLNPLRRTGLRIPGPSESTVYNSILV